MFSIENLQPSWLQEQRWQLAYILASRSIAGLIIGLITGFSTELGIELILASPYLRGGGMATLEQILSDLVSGFMVKLPVVIILGILLGLVGGLTVGLIDFFRFKARDKSPAAKNRSPFWRSVVNVWALGLSLLLSVALLGGPLSAVVIEAILIKSPILNFAELLLIAGLMGLLTGPMAGLIGGLIFGLRGMRQSLMNDIQPVERLGWSWNQARTGIPFGLVAGLIVTLSASWLAGYLGSPHPLLEGLSLGLFVGMLGPLFRGLRGMIVEAKTFPNQGIRLSQQNAVFAGFIAGMMGVLFIGLFFCLLEISKFGLTIGLIIGSVSGLIVGLMEGLIVALWYGGLDVIQHYVLRFILFLQGHTPRNYSDFLDYAVDRIFLQKVGGGYRFIHRLLLEHFAEMDELKKV